MTNQNSSPWTDDLRAEAKTLYADHSAKQIADALNAKHGTAFTRNAVIGLLHREGLTSAVKTKPHPHDTYAPEHLRKQARRERTPQQHKPRKRKPRIHVVANGGGGLRMMTSFASELPEVRVDTNSRNVTLADLGADDCRFIAGDPQDGGTFCGHPRLIYLRNGKMHQSPWCHLHHLRCTEQPRPHRKADRPTWRSAA